MKQKQKPNFEFLKTQASFFSLKECPFEIALTLGKHHGWTLRQIETAEKILRKHWFK